MIPIKFLEPVHRTIKKIYSASFLDSEEDENFKKLNLWVKNNIKIYGISCYKDIITANYKKLCTVKKYIENNDNIHLDKELEDYIRDYLYKRKLNRKLFFESLRIDVCPYCNTNYLIQYTKGGNYQIDHFFPKDQNALMAVSFYNLVPCCYSCNHKKLNGEIKYSPHNSDYKDADELLKFFFWSQELLALNNIECIRVDIIPKSYIIKDNIKKFRLIEIYEKHKYEIVDMIKKRIIYSDEAINDLCSLYSNLFQNKGEVYRLLFGTDVEGNDDIKKPFSKFKRDIFRELS